MKHLGDITRINGANVPPVNVIIGGSPCQDLSVAGKRAGLSGERSGLFMEQLRIIKEMRQADENRGRTGKHIRPRFMVWENVPGAFSSNKGADFGAVLQETIRVVCKETPDIPMPKRGWPTAGVLVGMGGDWSIAWRVLDAQFWGVPQRRRRIALIADFGGTTAPEILFERESVSGNITQSGEQGQAPTGHSETGVGDTGAAGLAYCGYAEDLAPTLSATQIDAPVIAPTGYSQAAYDKFNADDKTSTLKAQGGSYGGGSETLIVEQIKQIAEAFDAGLKAGINAQNAQTAYALRMRSGCDGGGKGALIQKDKRGTLATGNDQTVFQSKSVCTATQQGDYANAEYTVRRLTPLECERLQGFPDGWTDIGEWTDSKGKKHKDSDSPRYKALGNSIAIPPWLYVLSKLSLCCGEDHTMASLFDGIGGFPYIWELLHGKGFCLWASEIEEFPIAVTRYHFSDT